MFNIKNFKYFILLSSIVSGGIAENFNNETSFRTKNFNNNINVVKETSTASSMMQEFRIYIDDLLNSNNVAEFIDNYKYLVASVKTLQEMKHSIIDYKKIINYIVEQFNFKRPEIIQCLKNLQQQALGSLPAYKQPFFAIKLSEYINILQESQIKNITDLNNYNLSKIFEKIKEDAKDNELNTGIDYIKYYIVNGNVSAEKYIEQYCNNLLKNMQIGDMGNTSYYSQFMQILNTMSKYEIFQQLYKTLDNAFIKVCEQKGLYNVTTDRFVNTYQNYQEEKSSKIKRSVRMESKNATGAIISALRNLREGNNDEFVKNLVGLAKSFSQMNSIVENLPDNSQKVYLRESVLKVLKIYNNENFIQEINSRSQKLINNEYFGQVFAQINNILHNNGTYFNKFKQLVNWYNQNKSTLPFILID